MTTTQTTWLTTTQAAARLGVSPRTVLRMIQAGRLPATRVNDGHYRIAASTVEALIRASATAEAEQD